MADIPKCAHAVVDLNPTQYQNSLNTFRMVLETHRDMPFLRIAVRTPGGEFLELQVRREDAYIIGFKGADGWYGFNGEAGTWGRTCGTGTSYSHLGTVGNVTYDDLKRLAELARFQAGATLDKRLVAIAIAVTSEAARFATVSTYFTGLTNSVGTSYSPYLKAGVNFEYLRHAYFTKWEKPPARTTSPGQVSHAASGEILLNRR